MTDNAETSVLVAEDDLRIRTVLERFLQNAGYQVTACLNGREALDAVEAGNEFDLLLTDINMPEMDGEELLREVKQRSPQMPVIVLTARSDPDLITECFKHDAYRYLVKPFTRDDLLTVVKAALTEASRRGPAESGRVRIQQFDDEKESGWVELTAPNRQEYLDRFQDFCDRLIDSRLDDRAKNELKIAVQELGQNAIEWGNKLDEERTIRLSYKLEADRIKIRIADEGHGFNPDHVPDPTVDPIQMIENREANGKRPGGFGIHLARKVMDFVHYNERGNVVTMEKRFL
jgi:CheY-like chemotaxis protein/anti-sigma regulatory factor (Ser/Thr protein kinase)